MIKLKRLEESDIVVLKEKELYCYERSDSYLMELNIEYPMLTGRIVGIIDNIRRNQGVTVVAGREIAIKDSACLAQVEWSDSVLLITSDYHEEAFEKLASLRELQNYHGIIYYFASRETRLEESYREQYQDQKLENIVLFRSGPHASSYVKGMDFTDNTRALFEYMLTEHLNDIYELVWLVKDPQQFTQYQSIKNVSFLSFDWSVSEDKEERDRYYRALCLARYLFFTDAYGFARNSRQDQIRIQLWHGCGFKTRVNFVRCEKRYEYTMVISDLYAKIHQDIYGLRPDQVLVTGYAKDDWLFHPLEDALERLEIPEAGKYIFWLPTFRTARMNLAQLNEYDLKGQTGLPLVDTYEKFEELDWLLDSLNTVVIIKLHPFQNSEKIGQIRMRHIVLLDNDMLTDQDIQINQLLGHADGLISDYSSVAVDYMLLDRPIGFTLGDVEEYKMSRGFVFENLREWLPGVELYSFGRFCAFVKDVASGVDLTMEKRQALRKIMHKYQDDQSSRRIVEALRMI